MKKSANKKTKLRRLLITCGILAVILTVMICLRQSVKASVFLQRTLSRAIIWVSGHLFGWIPFSMYELFLYAAGVTIITCLVHIIIRLFKRRWKKAATTAVSLALAALTLGTLYFASAGFAYAQTTSYAPAYQQEVSKEQLAAVCEYFLNDFNYLAVKLESELGRDKDGNLKSPYTDRQLSKKLQQEYKRLNVKEINNYTPGCKSILSSRIMSEMSVCGVFFAPFGEANINRDMPAVEKPYTMAHEMAHSKGVMRENDADTMATYITLTSDDEFIRYSGYLETASTLFYSWAQYGEPARYSELCALRAKPIIDDYKSMGVFWGKYHILNDFLSNITEKFIDFQLKLMGQKEGSQAYNPPAETKIEPDLDPDTGEQKKDENGAPSYVFTPIFTDIQKVYFAVAEEVLENRE